MRLALTAVLAIGLWGVPCLRAQQSGEAADAQLRNSCRLAAQVLETGQPNPKFAWATSVIRLCDQSGPAALAQAWENAPDDTVALGALVYATQRLRDQRLAAAALSLVTDPSRPQIVRLSAIQVLISYAAPGRTASLQNLLDPGDPPVLLTFVTDFQPAVGSEPLRPDTRGAIVTALEELAARDPDPAMRRAAEWVRARLPKP